MRGRRRHRGRCRTCGLAAAAELADAGRRIIILDQEGEASLGGQAFWSFGGLFFVDSPEQRRLRIRDSRELALQDWLGSAGFDRDEDHWPRRWAEAYVDFAAGEKRTWLRQQGLKIFPIVGWAERGGYLRDRPRQLGPALSRHLGHGTRRDRALCTACARGRIPRPRLVPLPPSRHWIDHDRLVRSTALRARCWSRAMRNAGRAKLAPRGRFVRAARTGDHRHVGRDRRQS